MSDTRGVRDFITDNENGILFEPENPKDLGDKILYLLKNPELMEKLGRNARDYAVKNRSWKNAAEVVEKALQKSMEEGLYWQNI